VCGDQYDVGVLGGGGVSGAPANKGFRAICLAHRLAVWICSTVQKGPQGTYSRRWGRNWIVMVCPLWHSDHLIHPQKCRASALRRGRVPVEMQQSRESMHIGAE
jgi:hypothetical protein